MATGPITIATGANFIPEIWSTDVLEALTDNVVAVPLLDHKYEPLVAAGGDTIHVPDLATIAARTLSSMTGTVTFDNNTETKTDISIDTLAYVAIKVDDALRIQSIVPELSLYTSELGRSLAEKMDDDAVGSSGLSSASQTVGTDNVDLTDDDILEAMALLDVGNVPHEGRFMLWSPRTKQAMFKVDKFVNSLYAAAVGPLDTNKGRGFLTKIYDADVYDTTNLRAGSSGKRNIYAQTDAIAWVSQKDVQVERRIPHDELTEAIIVWTLYGLKKMRDASVIEMDGK